MSPHAYARARARMLCCGPRSPHGRGQRCRVHTKLAPITRSMARRAARLRRVGGGDINENRSAAQVLVPYPGQVSQAIGRVARLAPALV
jgi:hypothetical protein